MINRLVYYIPLVFLFTGLLTNCGSPKNASEIKITNVWSWPAVKIDDEVGGVGVVYLTVSNSGMKPDTLLSISVDSNIAKKTEIHKTVVEDGRVKMKPVENSLEIPAQSQIEFTTGGSHIMLIGLKKNLETGDRFEVTISFQRGGTITTTSEVR